MNMELKMIRRTLVFFTLLLLLAVPSALRAQPAGEVVKPIQEKAHEKVYVIKLSGEVDDIMRHSLERRVAIAVHGGADLIVYDIDTYGGLLTSCLEMTRLTRDSRIPIVAWVHPKAYSAGAILALACSQIVVTSNASFGDCAPIVPGDTIPATERAKANSPVLQDIEASSKKNGFDRNTAWAMVEVEREVDELHNAVTGEVRYTADDADKAKLLNEQLITPDGKKTNPWRFSQVIDGPNTLLTVDAEMAIKLKFAQARADNLEDLRAVLNIRSEPVILDFTYAELFARWLGSYWVRGLLFTLMLIGAWIEFSHPGTMFGGIGALICLVLLVAAPYMAGIAQAWEIGLIVLGVAIILIDLIFAGGVGLAAVPGFILMAVGIVGTFIPAEPGGGWIPQLPQTYAALQSGISVVVFGTIAAMAAFFVMAKYLYMTPGLRRLQLKPAPATGGSVVLQDAIETAAGEAVFAGALGRASTDLRPAGKARFGEHLMDVATEGQFIRAGEVVKVLEANAARVVVKPYQPETEGGAPTAGPA
jgi:membrane-bound serine protease (ClpP class)